MAESNPVERETDLVLVKLKNGTEKHVTRALADNAELKIIKPAAKAAASGQEAPK